MPYASPLKFDYSPWLFWPQATEEERSRQLSHQAALASLPGVRIGEGVFLSEHANIDPAEFHIGENSYVAAHAYITDQVHLGSNTTVNPFTVIRGRVTIGDAVRIGAHTSIIAFNHSMHPDEPVYKQKHTVKGITIGDDVWIGSNVTILDGVTIGSHAVLAAGAIVTKHVADWSIVGGNPARHLRDRRQVGAAKPAPLAAKLADFGAMARRDASELIGRCWDPARNGGTYADAPGAAATVRAHCDAVELADLLLGSAPAQLTLSGHVARLQSLQDPATGLVPEYAPDGTPDAGPLEFGVGPATYHVLSAGYALDLLGSSFPHPVHAVARMDAAALVGALKGLTWQKNTWGAGAWIDAWGTASYWNLARGAGDSTAASTLFGWLLSNAHADTGAWGSPAEGSLLQTVNGYYRLTRGTFAQFGLPVPHAERLIDTVLGHGSDPRFFAPGRQNACNVLDVAHPLWLAKKQSNHRQDEVRAWAREQLDVALGHWVPGEGFAFSLAGDGRTECLPGLQGTEMWLAIIWYLADLLGESKALGYRPRGVHRPEAAFNLATV